ncbi:efflux RND transporter permease subunit [Amycolatopsis regifaucium]|uniref:Hydrogenase expression protein n=1 Tax=Amycolatopsis regifaucium TaxID=546365 RepID=A0A154MR32_9PSEU|nr:efflux RND transporter permease subunit [Amycolatopsis regifaucium]KZB86744.1 hydrogenase expression protein [Amycolatopsis regifaucium]OKA10848.1 hydrogenase expression protein [Amycolatopsis regifaucium]SFI19855.1 hydrophobic/amphiphilic exporter-1, HAE1 family [Amycolatopsis regifaucium]
MSTLARLSLRNRSLIGLLALVVIGFGAFALPQLKQQLFPSLQFPQAQIITPYAGASPDAVDRQVTEPLEGGLQGLKGLEELNSTSSEGLSRITAQFEFGTDIDAAVGQIQRVVDGVKARLPQNTEPTVSAGSTDDLPVVLLAAGTTGDPQALAPALTGEVAPELRKIDGVREVEVTGARQPRVTIALDYAKLAAAGVDPSSIATTLQTAGAAVPAGTLTEGDKTLTVQVGGGPTTVDTIRNLYLTPAPRPGAAAGKPVELGDVADVQAGFAPPTSITRTNGKPSLGLSITMVENGNAVAISDSVRDKLPELSKKIGAEMSVVFDQGTPVKDAISGLTTEGLLGLAFAVVVILLFLMSLRSTLVTAVSIPLSVVVALLALWTGDLSLNLLTLGALTIAIGRVVDDSIVVLENIKRHLAYGEEKQRAVLDGVREVAGAVTSSTLTTVAVFLPIAFVGGFVGELFSPFAITVTVALLASLLVSLTIVPVLAYWFLKPPKAPANEHEAELTRQAAEDKERRGLLQRGYVPVIRFATRRRVTVVLLALIIFGGTVGLASRLNTNFLDQSGGTTLNLSQKLPPGTSSEAKEKAAGAVERALAAEPAVETYQVSIGGAGFFGMGGTSTGISVTVAKDTDLDALSNRLRDKLKRPELGEVKVGADASGFNSDGVSITVTAPDEAALKPAAEQVRQALSQVPDLTEVTSDLAQGSPRVQVEVDAAKAAASGLSATSIGQIANQAIAGRTVTQLPVDGQRTDIVLRAGTAAPVSVDAIKALPIPAATGVVRLDSVANVSTVDGPAAVHRTSGELSTTVTAKNTGADLAATTKAIQSKLDGLTFTGGAAYKLGGVSEDQQEAFGNLFLALLAAIAIVYLIMVATFRSLLQPLILLVSIPFAATGAIGLLLATGTALGLPALIGMLMLVGIVVTNAIVLIDLINQYRASGMSVAEAVTEGGRRRLRPILMTAAATIFALVPMALGLTGQGGFIGQPLAIVVIGGLVSSTLLTLILVPTLYTMVEIRKEKRRAKKDAKRSSAPASETLTPEPAS